MFKIEDLTEVTLNAVTNRVEKHGDDDAPAVTLALSLTGPNTLLDAIDPQIRQALYKAVDGQESVPGVEPTTPVLRCNSFDSIALTTSHEGWTLEVDDSATAHEPMKLGGCKVDKLRIDARQGGSVELAFRVGTSDVDGDRLGWLAMHNRGSVWVRLLPPKAPEKAIDGSAEAFERDHPAGDGDGPLFDGGDDDHAAGDAFSAAHGGPEGGDEPGEDDGSGHTDEAVGGPYEERPRRARSRKAAAAVE